MRDKSYGESFQETDFIPGDKAFKDAGVGQSHSEESEEVEGKNGPVGLAHRCKPSELLVSLDIKRMRIILVLISSVPVDEVVEGSHKAVLAGIISKVVPFDVVEEDVVLFVEDVADLSTLVKAGSDRKHLVGSMRDYLSAAGALLGADGHVVVALDPELEEAASLHHFIVGGLVLRTSLHVVQVLPQVAAADPQEQVEHVGGCDYADTAPH